MKGDHEKKSDRGRVHHKKERWGEFTIRKSDGIRLHHEKKSDRVRFRHEKESDGVRVECEKMNDGDES